MRRAEAAAANNSFLKGCTVEVAGVLVSGCLLDVECRQSLNLGTRIWRVVQLLLEGHPHHLLTMIRVEVLEEQG